MKRVLSFTSDRKNGTHHYGLMFIKYSKDKERLGELLENEYEEIAELNDVSVETVKEIERQGEPKTKGNSC